MSLAVLASAFLAVTAPAAGGAATAGQRPPTQAQQGLTPPTISPKAESSCGIVTKPDPKAKGEFHVVTGLKVLGGPMKLTLPQAKVPIAAVYCKRDTVVPGDGDARVLFELGQPLVLQDESRQGVLQLTDKGRYAFSLTLGTVTDVEKQSITSRLNIFQARLAALQQAAAAARAKAQTSAPNPSDAPTATKR